jgi:hypothetical protein
MLLPHLSRELLIAESTHCKDSLVNHEIFLPKELGKFKLTLSLLSTYLLPALGILGLGTPNSFYGSSVEYRWISSLRLSLSFIVYQLLV